MQRPHLPWLHRALLALAAALPATLSAAMLTPAQWREDIATLREAIAQTHPDLSFSTDAALLAQRMAALEREVDRPLDRDEAWRRLATLNPLLADAHFCVCFDDWRGESAALGAAGGGLFPFELQVGADGNLRVRNRLGGGSTPLAGAVVNAINGRPAKAIAADLLARMHGDTPEFRAALLSRRFGFYFWKMYGSSTHFELELAAPAPARLRAAAAPPPPAAAFAQEFRLELLPDAAAVLSVGSFAWPDKAQLLAFFEDSFRRLRDNGVRTLVIDIRDNGGGNDDQWLDGLMPYLADRPFRFASGYRKKIIAKYADAGDAVGSVVDGGIERWIGSQTDHPLFFRGKVYVLVGRGTYSSAVLFSNVMQDFHFATIAGSGNLVRARQSGGVQSLPLRHSGLVAAVPRFLLDRPAGPSGAALLMPDRVLSDDPLQPHAVIAALLQQN